LTRQEIRYKYKIQRDSIETIRYVTKWKTKEVVKVAKIQQSKRFNWFWIGLGIGLIIPILTKFVIKKI
jgi:formate-dependent nitrite reductase membrane component NrfD